MSPTGCVPGLWDTTVSSHRRSMEMKKGFFRSAAGSGGFMGSNLVARVFLFVCFRSQGGVSPPRAGPAAGSGEGTIAGIPRRPFGISKSLPLS